MKVVKTSRFAIVRIKKPCTQKTSMRSISSSGMGYGLFLRARGVRNGPPRKTKNCKSPGICPGGIVTSQIEPCITYQLAKGANTVSTDICQRGACYL